MGDFRVLYSTDKYEETVAFYRDGLGLPVDVSWDDGEEERGTVFKAGSGFIEVMAFAASKGHEWVLYSPDMPRGLNFAIEVDDVDAWYQRIKQKNLPIKHELASFNWGQRGFGVIEPNGGIIFLYNYTD